MVLKIAHLKTHVRCKFLSCTYLLEKLQAVLTEEAKVDLLHVNEEAEEVTDTLAHRTHILLLGVKPLDSVLRRVQGSQGTCSFLFRELKFSGRATMHPCHVMVESSRETKPYESKFNENTIAD